MARRQYSNENNENHRKNRQGQYNVKEKNKKHKSNSKKLNSFFQLMTFIYVVITIIFYISVLKLDLLPTIYVTIFTIAEVIFTVMLTIGLVKRRKTYKINIICLIIAIIISSVYIFVSYYTFATSSFLGNVFQEVEETEDYYLLVRKDSSYNNIEDVKNKTIYFYQIEDDVKVEIGTKITVVLKAKDNLVEIGNDLLKSKSDVILVSSAQYSMLSEEIKQFKENTKIIYTATHKVKKEVSAEPEKDNIIMNQETFNVYISGIDTSRKD